DSAIVAGAHFDPVVTNGAIGADAGNANAGAFLRPTRIALPRRIDVEAVDHDPTLVHQFDAGGTLRIGSVLVDSDTRHRPVGDRIARSSRGRDGEADICSRMKEHRLARFGYRNRAARIDVV